MITLYISVSRKTITTLSSIFELTTSELKQNLAHQAIFNWQKFPTSLGAYSYEKVESKEAKELLNSPINETLYFCGEALYTGTAPGTVEAAIESALDMVKKIDR